MAEEPPKSEPATPPPAEEGADPVAEELTPESQSPDGSSPDQPTIITQAARRRHAAYRPSHKATFIGLAVVAAILAANGAALAFILGNQQATQKAAQGTVTLSSDTLNKLGVSRDTVGKQGIKLSINPDTTFGSSVTISSNLAVGGQLNLNGPFTAPSGAFNNLQGGTTSVQSLNVNNDATASNLNLRQDLTVVGATHLQGQLTVSQLATINNNLNVAGSLSVGGALVVTTLQIGNLTITAHLITQGSSPTVAVGSATGSNGTAAISGTDTGGTVSLGVGAGSSAGVLASVTFHTHYDITPHVVVTPVGKSVPGFYINRTSTGFSISTPSALGYGGFAFDYIVVQ